MDDNPGIANDGFTAEGGEERQSDEHGAQSEVRVGVEIGGHEERRAVLFEFRLSGVGENGWHDRG